MTQSSIVNAVIVSENFGSCGMLTSDNSLCMAIILQSDSDIANINFGMKMHLPTNQAIILPKVVSPHENILNPTPGLKVYDTASGQLAVFNGFVWSFWKP